jgi:hypothetical protein
MRDPTLVKLWSEVSRSFLSRAAPAREQETAQNAFLAGALGVFLHLEKAFESGDETAVATALKRLRRELNLGIRPRARAQTRIAAAARPSRIPRKR